MATSPSLRKLTTALERLRQRLDRVSDAFIDEDIHVSLARLSTQLSAAALMLREPTRENLARAAVEIDDAAKQFEAMVSRR